MLSLEFCSLQKVQKAFEAEGEPTIDLQKLPKLNLTSLDHLKDETIRIHDEFLIKISANLGISLKFGNSINNNKVKRIKAYIQQ